ncbi:hypothetical protein [Klebsiella pneumoniae]|uniref:hypothetical protein n=1 Tax=Klebsiella pneumoniae TaxID=573 RepID=UPI001E35FFF1|nr:hypothetical protein [Klebsiella pneumoniae]
MTTTATSAPLTKQKKMRIGFFQSSSGTKSTTSNAQLAFDKMYTTVVTPSQNSYTAEFNKKKLKIVFLEKTHRQSSILVIYHALVMVSTYLILVMKIGTNTIFH